MRRLLIPTTFLVAALAAACTTGAGATPVPPVVTPPPATVAPASVAPPVAGSGPRAAACMAASYAPASSTAAWNAPVTYEATPCPPSSPAAGGDDTVAISTGGYLVGPNGLALYQFDKDATPKTSACSG